MGTEIFDLGYAEHRPLDLAPELSAAKKGEEQHGDPICPKPDSRPQRCISIIIRRRACNADGGRQQLAVRRESDGNSDGCHLQGLHGGQ